MKLSTKGRYAMVALTDLAQSADTGLVSLGEISRRQDVSLPYLEQLFDAARRHVIVYSSNTDERVPSLYLRHWRFTPWVAERRPEWRLVETIDNRYPQQGPDDPTTSHADFYIFTKSVKG